MSAPLRTGARLRVGLDIGGTKIAAVLLDEEAHIVARVRRSTRHGMPGLLQSVTSAIEELLEIAGGAASQLKSIGLGIPGLVDAAAGIVQHAVNLGIGEEGLDMRAALQEKFPAAQVYVENDLNVGALGAVALLDLGKIDLAYLAIGTGLAAGFVLQGKPRSGANGAAGEIGHIPVDPFGEKCACGQRGCLETVVSGTAIARKWSTTNSRPAPAALFAEAARGNTEAIKVRDEFAVGVAAAIRMVALSMDVDVIVLGGGVSELGKPLLDVVQEALRAQARGSRLLESLRLDKRIELLPPGSAAAAIGAALLGSGLADTVPILANAQGPHAQGHPSADLHLRAEIAATKS
ncbi:MAG TPA: ROK family protein [Actinomycetales bacterium]|nr:ROK family protein [Actinomycetales bacterium]